MGMRYQRHGGAVRRFARTMKFGQWLQGLLQRLTPPPFRLMQIGSAFWQSRALHAAVRLDVADVLGDDTLGAADIAARVGADADALARLLRLLSALGVFEETAPRVWRNNALSAHLRREHPQSVRAMVLAGASFDLQMFMGSRGRERTQGEWQALFSRSGVRLAEAVGLRSFARILVLQPDRSPAASA